MAAKRLKLKAIYHGTNADIKGQIKPSTNPDTALYGSGVYATDEEGAKRYGKNRHKMLINPKKLETVKKGPYDKQQKESQKLRKSRKNVRVKSPKGKGDYYVLSGASANRARTPRLPTIKVPKGMKYNMGGPLTFLQALDEAIEAKTGKSPSDTLAEGANRILMKIIGR